MTELSRAFRLALIAAAIVCVGASVVLAASREASQLRAVRAPLQESLDRLMQAQPTQSSRDTLAPWRRHPDGSWTDRNGTITFSLDRCGVNPCVVVTESGTKTDEFRSAQDLRDWSCRAGGLVSPVPQWCQ